MTWTVGVDVGGSFTDFFAVNEHDGRTAVHKVLSTPQNPAQAIIQGLREMCDDHGIATHAISRFSHGTTVGTNALIQRKGARVALVTTSGFRDLLEIGRQTRPSIFSLQLDHPAPLVPRGLCFELDERTGPGGEIVRSPSDVGILETIDRVRESGVDACAVCFLFSFAADSNERRIAAALRKGIPGLYVSRSSDIYPEIREFERFSTTVLNAYLQPVFDEYLTTLESVLGEIIPSAAIGINQSNGGLTSIGTGRDYPVRTILSGPAAGVLGSIHVALESSYKNVITLDMGGTSADVGLVREGEADLSTSRDVAGFPVRLPMIDIHTVGAGGGSVAWIDRDGLLKVGPRSAGADPGPACYGRGGVEPTVSDANAVLGRLDPSGLLGGKMKIDLDAARNAIRLVAEPIGHSVEATALGISDIVVANMVRAVRRISVERGYDPRDYTLMSFGGAGGLHAVEVGRMLGIRKVVVPHSPGILCAMGLVVADMKEDLVRSTRLPVTDGNLESLRPVLEGLAKDLDDWFEAERIPGCDRDCQIALDMRFVGQNHELRVPLPDASVDSVPSGSRLTDMFLTEHRRCYGYANADDRIEIINVRLTGFGRRRRDSSRERKRSNRDLKCPRPVTVRPVLFDIATDTPADTPVFDRDVLEPGQWLRGPAVVRQLDSTTILGPGDILLVDEHRNLVIDVS
ncbi:MAG: hydantoinase/oxoprolinase family protein [Paracoccaceae bacterium]|nr:hydantoinase/oxoprolinase family protein [Paracoccaceae bacterium]